MARIIGTLAHMNDMPPNDTKRETNPIIDLLEHFDRLQLEVLGVHAAIQRWLFKILAARLKCEIDDLPDLRFMHVARLAYAGNDPANTVALLQKLDSVRNEVAHENNPTEFVSKFQVFARAVLGPNYDDNPRDLETERKQEYAALHYVKVLVNTKSAG